MQMAMEEWSDVREKLRETRQWAKGQRAFSVDIDGSKNMDGHGWMFCAVVVLWIPYLSIHPFSCCIF